MKALRIGFWAAVLAVAAWSTLVEPLLLVTREYPVQVDTPLAPLRVAVLTDLHLGSPQQGVKYLERVIERTNALDPDLVLLAGDYFYEYVFRTDYPPTVLSAPLARLHAPLGKFAVLGNHDNNMDTAGIRRALQAGGVQVMHNQAARLRDGPAGGLWLVGLADFATGGVQPDRAWRALPADARVLVFSHSPDVFPILGPGHRFLLGIAGHLHGGQVRVPLLGPPYLPSLHGRRFLGRQRRRCQ